MNRPVNTTVLAMFLFAAAGAGVAIAQDSRASPVHATTPAMPVKLTPADRNFLAQAGASNQKEIDVSVMAARKATLPEVKEFASMMVCDHTKLGTDLKKLDDGAIPASVVAPQSDPLAETTGKVFDQAYMSMMVNDHASVERQFDQVSRGAKYSPAVRAAAIAALPTIRHHAEMARELDRRARGN